MNDAYFNFNPLAMSKPQTLDDFIVLLDEALREVDLLTYHIDQVTKQCELNQRNTK